MCKRAAVLITFIICTLFPSTLLRGMEAFVINEYRVNVIVGENNVYLVTEDLDVTFSEPRHGLFRDIPVRYTHPITGKTRNILVNNIQVNGHPYRVEKNRNNINIRIGSAEEYVNGNKHYQISYTLNVGNDKIPEYDEFYMNLIGPQWDTQINQARFEVVFPKPFDTTMYNLTAGRQGSTDNSSFSHRIDGNILKAATTRALQPYEGVTLRVELPDGYFIGAREIRDNFYRKMYFFLLLALFLSAFLWFRYGRDALVVTPVEFTAPEGMTPAETGYIIDGHTDTRDITSLLIYWADKGFMAIEEIDKKNFRFIKLKPLTPEAKSFEKSFFDDLFQNRDQVETSELKFKFAESLKFAQRDVTEFFREDPEKRIFTLKSRWARMFISLLILLTAGITTWKLVYEIGGSNAPQFILAAIAGVLVTVIAGSIQMILDKWQAMGSIKRLFLLILATLPLLIVTLIILAVSSDSPQLQVLVLFSFVTIAVLTVFSFIARKRTERGTNLLGRILGLKDFIKRAELDRIKMLVDENPQYFYSVLPFAYSLGLSEKWAKNFDAILTPPPTWYQGNTSYGNHFTPVLFASSLNNAMRTTQANMAAVKGSSGGGGMSGGGGFSGGGVGGGGGGSW
jgi:uncharacterized membrane protein YgcG